MSKTVMVETSARHLHVSQDVLEKLFGEGAELTKKKDLSQPGQFACEEKVTVVGAKGEFKMTILGPVRKDSQVELSLSDATPGCKLIGPKGEVEISKGVIAAKRHIHLDPKTAEEFGVQDKQIVSLKINGTERALIFGDVVIRVSPNFAPAAHLDTDEANAAGLTGNIDGEIITE